MSQDNNLITIFILQKSAKDILTLILYLNEKRGKSEGEEGNLNLLTDDDWLPIFVIYNQISLNSYIVFP